MSTLVYDACGCEDNITPPVEVPAPPTCTDGEPCAEILNAKCVKYTGVDITCLTITTNDRLDVILGKIATALCQGLSVVQHTDTNNIQILGAGTTADPLEADVVIDPVANNILTTSVDGLKVLIDTTEITRILNAIDADSTMKALFQSIATA